MEKRGVIDPHQTPHDDSLCKEAKEVTAEELLGRLEDSPQARLAERVAKCCGGSCRKNPGKQAE